MRVVQLFSLSLFMLFFASFTFTAYSQETNTSASSSPSQEVTNTLPNSAYIADDLFIFMRSGAGTQYRLLGTINAGTPITLLEEHKNGFSKIKDDKERTGWVEDKYIQKTPALRAVIAELNAQLASKEESLQLLDNELQALKEQYQNTEQQRQQLQTQLTATSQKLTTANRQLSQQDTEIKKQWFYNGAIVLGVGLLFGLLLPRLVARRRTSMDSWK